MMKEILDKRKRTVGFVDGSTIYNLSREIAGHVESNEIKDRLNTVVGFVDKNKILDRDYRIVAYFFDNWVEGAYSRKLGYALTDDLDELACAAAYLSILQHHWI